MGSFRHASVFILKTSGEMTQPGQRALAQFIHGGRVLPAGDVVIDVVFQLFTQRAPGGESDFFWTAFEAIDSIEIVILECAPRFHAGVHGYSPASRTLRIASARSLT